MNRLDILFIALAFSFLFSINSLAQEHVEKEINESSETGPRNLKGDSYFEMGTNIGMPATINVAIGYWFGPVGLRLSGMYWGEGTQKGTNGVQFNAGYKLSDNAKSLQNLGVAVGREQGPGCDWSYLGPVYNLNYKWFFLEIGLAKVLKVKRGAFGSLQFIFQIGYMHRFFPKPK